MTKPIKRFEVLGESGNWTVWQADKDTKITMNKNVVTISGKREDLTFTVTAKLAQIPIYTLAR